MKALYQAHCFSPITWKGMLVVAHFSLNVIFISLLVAEVSFEIVLSVFASISRHLLRPKSKAAPSSPVQS